MRTWKILLACLLAALAAACGGSPTGPDTITGLPVNGAVFYDENGNGVLDPGEAVRLPNVTVSVGSRTAQTADGGLFTVQDVPTGTQSASVQPASLPAYFTPGAPVSVTVPQTGTLAVPATLPIGTSAHPNAYSAFGDSITCGDGSSTGGGYRDLLAAQLKAYWGRADVSNDCLTGSKSRVGEARIGAVLSQRRPAYVLILYGTNDFNDSGCRADPSGCFTVDALRSMIQQTRDQGAMPVLGTIPPVNPEYVDRNADERNAWVTEMNTLVRQMATQEKVAVAEVHGNFLKQPSLSALFSDDKHPNDAGYQLIAQSFFDAVTKPIGATTSGHARLPFRLGPF
ncbi:MAG TPA: SGNH/GDSL hydrolase family protein [Vicinamibacteria bacterium]|nr:SGNH/GDSL hydrolase family protein [Vicinamibacteria bacterium]